ncbi:hypothetical protein [Burkholderia sp. Ax-1724]|uniref:hypothetical protein n=1 Tax=Burkholderia sp. Ax-1724 TaxID=2608336 RepID=UPI001422E4C5|nr:hypothetical protein [Burkholderia sp. Ax-1724]NIF52603.1 hypothetical protein [Burkholderia sp. Ax-1724]
MAFAAFDGPEWKRSHVGVRLTQRRKARLIALARELPPEATPTDAIDRALDIAHAWLISRGREEEEAFGASDIAASLNRLDAGLAAATALLDNKLTLVADRLAATRPLLEEAAAGARRLHRLADAAQANDESDLDVDDGEDRAEPLSIGDWLSAEARRAGRQILKSALVRAEWSAARKVSRGRLSVDFSCRLLAIDGEHVRNLASPISLARMDLVDSRSALASVSAINPVCFLCEPRPVEAWLVRVHSVQAEGKIGEMIASFEA